MASPASTPSRAPELSGEPGANHQNHHPSAKLPGEAIAITVHDDFLLELGDALGGQIAVRPVDSFATAVEHVSGSRRAQILLIDSRNAEDLRGDVERAHTQAPHLPIIVFAASESEKTVAAGLKSSNVFAVLPIPVDPRKTAAILEGALADAAAKRNAARAAERGADTRGGPKAPLVPELQPLPAAALDAPEEEPPSRKGLLIAVIAAVVVAAAAAGLYLKGRTHSGGMAAPVPGASASHAARIGPAGPGAAGARGATVAGSAETQPGATGPEASGAAGAAGTLPAGEGATGTAAGAPEGQAAATTFEAAQVPLVAGTLDELLEKARLAMRERRYTEPAGNCALLYYRSALKVDPASGEARDGMTRLASLLMSRLDDAMSASRYDEASAAIADLKVAAPSDGRLPALQARLLQAEINKAFMDDDFDRATALVRQAQQSGVVPASELSKWRTELARDQSEARASHLADLFNERLREGRLVAPGSDNAKYYLAQLQQLAPQSSAAVRGTRDLVAALLAKARDTAVAGDSADADKWVAEARADGMTAGELAAYQREIAAAREKAASAEEGRLAELARDRLQSGALTSPADDSAAYYLAKLKSTYGDTAAVHSIGLELASNLLERATASARAGKVDEMNADLTVARRWGADPALVQAVQQIVTGPPKAAAQPAAAAAPGVPAGYVPQRVRYVAPEFPEAALDAHLSGAVTVEFTVDLDGIPRDVRVVQSKPHGVFDYAAISAVSHWRFAPPPAAIPTRTVIRFDAPSN